jgi:hypothetical protein
VAASTLRPLFEPDGRRLCVPMTELIERGLGVPFPDWLKPSTSAVTGSADGARSSAWTVSVGCWSSTLLSASKSGHSALRQQEWAQSAWEPTTPGIYADVRSRLVVTDDPAATDTLTGGDGTDWFWRCPVFFVSGSRGIRTGIG